MIKYINLKTIYGVETIDELSQSDFGNFKDFRKELSRLISEYRLTGQNAYISQRCDKSWNK